MDGLHFFLQQYDFSRSVIEGMILSGLSDEQIRHHPQEGQNSLAWLIWHVARWEDFSMTILVFRPSLPFHFITIETDPQLNHKRAYAAGHTHSAAQRLARQPPTGSTASLDRYSRFAASVC